MDDINCRPARKSLQKMFSDLMLNAQSRRVDYRPFRWDLTFHNIDLMPTLQTPQYQYLQELFNQHLSDAIYYRDERERMLGGRYSIDDEHDDQYTIDIHEQMDQALLQAWDIYCTFRLTFLYLRATYMQAVTKVNNVQAGRRAMDLAYNETVGDSQLDCNVLEQM